jgi:hypothetical protein
MLLKKVNSASECCWPLADDDEQAAYLGEVNANDRVSDATPEEICHE